METPDTAELLLDFCARKLSPENTAILERHFEICPSCRSFAEGQRAVWAALDSYAEWDAPPVSEDFDRRLYQRIEQDVPWWDALVRPFRPLLAHRRITAAVAAAAACLVIMAGVAIEHTGKPARPATPETSAVVMEVQPEQVEQALDEMDMLSEFSHKVRREGASKL